MTELAKRIKLRTVISSGAGLALATVVYTSNMQVGLYVSGNSGWIPVLIAAAIAFLASFVFAELIGLYPTAAGLKLFIEKAFSERVALLFSTAYVGVTVAVVGAETYILSAVLSSAFPAVPRLFWIFFFLLTVALINIRGVVLAGTAQDITTYALFAGLIGISVVALVKNNFALVTPFHPGSGMGLAQAVALGVFLYLGFEWVTQLAEEVPDFHMIPRGMFGALILLGLTYALFNIAMTSTVAKELLAQSPVPHILFGQALLGRTGVLLFVVLSILASVTSFNSGIMTASRLIYAMSRDRALPRVFSQLHPTWATPWAAILLLLGIALAVSLAVYATGYYKILIFLGAAVECMIYVVMAASLLGLRKREPDRPRPFRVPLGRLIPVLVMLVYGALFVLVFLPDSTHPEDIPSQMAALVSFAIVLLLTAGYVLGVVPKLRKRFAAQDASRQRRRPGRPVSGD